MSQPQLLRTAEITLPKVRRSRIFEIYPIREGAGLGQSNTSPAWNVLGQECISSPGLPQGHQLSISLYKDPPPKSMLLPCPELSTCCMESDRETMETERDVHCPGPQSRV